jgi:hypothetical protein
MLQSEANTINSMYYHHPNTQGLTNTTTNTQHVTNSQSPLNVQGQPNTQYYPITQGQPNMQYSTYMQPQPSMTVNNPIPNYANIYPSVNIQGQQLSHMLPNQITPQIQAPMLSLEANTHNHGTSDYSMTSEEEEMQNNDTTTDKHPWQKVENKRKRRKGYNATNVTSDDTSTSNRYQPLEQLSNTNEEKTESKQLKEPRPPPIYIYGVTDFKAMTETLSQIVADEQYHTRTTTENTVKITLKTVASYRKLVHHLKEEGIVYHTYQPKEDRAYRIVIRGLHPSIQTEEIREELSYKGHKVRNLINIKHRLTKNPLPLFYVDLEPQANNKDIYDIEFLCHTRITVEPPRKRNEIIQCMRCQRYGHSKSYCTKPYNCVRCGRAHDSRTCKKPRDTPATCALCNGDHPANFKGCSVYQDLINLKTNTNRNYAPLQQQNQQQLGQQQSDPRTTSTLLQNHQHNRRLTYAQSVRNETHTPTANHETETLTTTLTSFLNQFKEMFNQLLNQNSMILNMLTTVISKIAH